MLGSLKILSTFLYNHNAANLKKFFVQQFNFQIIDYNIINKYIIYKINQYTTANIKDFSL